MKSSEDIFANRFIVLYKNISLTLLNFMKSFKLIYLILT